MEERGWSGKDRRAGPERREGIERREEDRPLSVLELVDRGARNAAQQVAQIHRRRLVTHAFAAALIAALIVCVPLILVTNGQRAADARANATYNCYAMKAIAHTFSGFIESDAKLRYEQQHYAQRAKVVAAFGRILDKGLLVKIQSDADRNDRNTQRYWTAVLQPRLEALAKTNCSAALR